MPALRFVRYAIMNLLLVLNLVWLCLGGGWLWLGFIAGLILSTAVDEAVGDDTATPGGAPRVFLDLMLYATLPLLALNSLFLAFHVSSGDALGLGAAMRTLGVDLFAARASTGGWTLAGGILALGMYLGAAGINVAHELIHRTETSFALAVGRWLLAFSCDTTFAIEHVYGHHRSVGTEADPATARRGEWMPAFAWRSFVGGNIGAFRHEAARLERKGLPVWSWHNRAVSWQAASLAIALVWMAMAGWLGLGVFLLCAIQGKAYLEAVNYVEHYGLVRVPGMSIEPRHSWNTYRATSSALLYNLPRHAHHHRFASKPFWQLEPEPDGPTLPFGYMTAILVASVPPLWHRVVDPLLAEWDRTQASAAERKFLADRGLLLG